VLPKRQALNGFLGCLRRRKRQRLRHGLLTTITAACLRRLERTARMRLAVRKTSDLLLAAEMELRDLRIADRPTAAALGERLDVLTLLDRNDEFLGWRRIGL